MVHKATAIKVCLICSNPFPSSFERRKYCSPACQQYARAMKRAKASKVRYHKHPKPHCLECGKPTSFRTITNLCRSCSSKGERSAQWKGGRLRNAEGYIRVYKPNYPRADKKGYVSEHIWIWEQANKKSLPKGWIIHHLNGIRDDNRLMNLQALSDRKHRYILQAKAKRIQELEALLNNQAQLI